MRKTLYDPVSATQPNGLLLQNPDGGGIETIPVRSWQLRGVSASRAVPADDVSPLNVLCLATKNIINSGWNFIHKDGDTDIAVPEPGNPSYRYSDIQDLVPAGVGSFERIGDKLTNVNINYQSSWTIQPVVPGVYPLEAEFRVLKGFCKESQLLSIMRIMNTHRS